MFAALLPLAAVVAGAIASNMQQKSAEKKLKKQHDQDILMQYARDLDPSTPIYGYNEQRQMSALKDQGAANRSSLIAQLLPAALSAWGSASVQPSSEKQFTDAVGRVQNAPLGRSTRPFFNPAQRMTPEWW